MIFDRILQKMLQLDIVKTQKNQKERIDIMRLPNGFGNVSQLSGNRRKPYRARVTVGWLKDESGRKRQQFKTIGYYATREEGILALCNYHQNPNLPLEEATFGEVYKLWSKVHYPKISKSNERGYTAAFHKCHVLHDQIFSELRCAQLQEVIDLSDKNYPVLRRIKILYSQLYKYALQNDICEKDYSRFVDVVQYKDRNPNAYNRQPFSQDEIDRLWRISSYNPSAMIVLMMIYSGCRIGELLALKKEDVQLQQQYFYIRQAKTASGIRYVPIAKKVLPFWKWWYEKNESPYLISSPKTTSISYHNFYGSYWKPLMEDLDMNHYPHDTRHTCISLLTIAGINDKIIRKIVGHKGQNVTEIVYTHFMIRELQDAINKI